MAQCLSGFWYKHVLQVFIILNVESHLNGIYSNPFLFKEKRPTYIFHVANMWFTFARLHQKTNHRLLECRRSNKVKDWQDLERIYEHESSHKNWFSVWRTLTSQQQAMEIDETRMEFSCFLVCIKTFGPFHTGFQKTNERNGVCKNVSTQFLKFCPSILVFPVTKPSAKSELKTCLQVRKHPQTVLPFAMKIKWVEHNKNTIQLSITSIPKFMNQISVQWQFALIHALPLPFVDLRPIQRLHRGGRRIWMQRSLNAWFFRKKHFFSSDLSWKFPGNCPPMASDQQS